MEPPVVFCLRCQPKARAHIERCSDYHPTNHTDPVAWECTCCGQRIEFACRTCREAA